MNHKVRITNIPKAIIKPIGTSGKSKCVLYACEESESGYASVRFSESEFYPVPGNDNVMNVVVWSHQKLLKSVKQDGKYVTSNITPEDFLREFEETHSPSVTARRRDRGRGVEPEDSTDHNIDFDDWYM